MCSVRRLPIRFTVGTGGTIEMWAQAAQSRENYDRTGVLAEYGFLTVRSPVVVPITG